MALPWLNRLSKLSGRDESTTGGRTGVSRQSGGRESETRASKASRQEPRIAFPTCLSSSTALLRYRLSSPGEPRSRRTRNSARCCSPTPFVVRRTGSLVRLVVGEDNANTGLADITERQKPNFTQRKHRIQGVWHGDSDIKSYSFNKDGSAARQMYLVSFPAARMDGAGELETISSLTTRAMAEKHQTLPYQPSHQLRIRVTVESSKESSLRVSSA